MLHVGEVFMSAISSVHGSCLCGAVRFEVGLPTAWCAHCHCTMCRRAHGAAYVTWFGAARERFKITSGETSLVRFQSSEHGVRSFCGRCGSTLFCELEEHPGVIDVVLANMSEALDRRPQMHVWFSDRAEWTNVGCDGLPRLGGATGMEPLGDERDL